MAKRRRLLLPAALLAAVIALGLWYTRPRSLDAIVGNAEVVSLSALYNEATLTITDGGSVADISVWQTGGGLTPDDPVGAALTAALEEGRYRATLLNLAGPRDRLGQDTSGTVQLSLALDNGEFLSLTFGSGGQLTVGRADGLYAYTADRGQYDTLAAIIRIHGQPVPQTGHSALNKSKGWSRRPLVGDCCPLLPTGGRFAMAGTRSSPLEKRGLSPPSGGDWGVLVSCRGYGEKHGEETLRHGSRRATSLFKGGFWGDGAPGRRAPRAGKCLIRPFGPPSPKGEGFWVP